LSPAVVAIVYQLPLKAALYISRPAMDRLAREVLDSGNQYADDRWCGVYKATRVKVIPTPATRARSVRITVEESNRAYRSGFAIFPAPTPAATTAAPTLRRRRVVVVAGRGMRPGQRAQYFGPGGIRRRCRVVGAASLIAAAAPAL
jgi:hypothetical protein